MISLSLELNFAKEMKKELKEIIEQLKLKDKTIVKLTTNKLRVELDRKDERFIKSLNGIKIIYRLENNKCLLLLGNMSCVYKDKFCGEFFCKNIVIENGNSYSNIKGMEVELDFSNVFNRTSNDFLKVYMEKISKHPDFVYNIGQFDEFMEIFEYYKKLSSELNNNKSFNVLSISDEYCFISVNEKEFDSEYKDEVYDTNGVLLGYKFEDYIYETLSNDLKEKVQFLVDVKIKADKDDIKKIRGIGADNVYLSDEQVVTEKNMRKLNQFFLFNIQPMKDCLILSGELKENIKAGYLNLYDMGQKIKVESIDNSLRLINQGASGAASELLTYLIGDAPMPCATMVNDETKEKYMEGLNDSQREAFLKCVDGSPVSLIKGPPGTGKNHVINAIVQYITKELKEKVIISSQTHIAIDNVLDKLMTNYDVIIPNRITNRKNKYSGDEIDKTLYKTWGVNFKEHNKRASSKIIAKKIEEDLKKFDGQQKFNFSIETDISEYSVIGATTTTSAIAGRKGLEVLEGYDWLIIDEVSKCPITEVLRYLPYVSKIIMVGDDYQLAPLLEFNKEDVCDLPSFDQDMFEKLQNLYEQSVFAETLTKARNRGRLVVLNENYRSVKDILSCYNVFYNNELIGRREEVNPDMTQFDSKIFDPTKSVFFVEVNHGKEVNEGTSRYNLEELKATEDILAKLIDEVVDAEKVTVAAIFPYSAQIQKFHKNSIVLINKAKRKFKSFEINTVDAFQGKEADIVLLNTVVADSSKKNFLSDFRRINVSMSRAKDKLIIFGNSKVLSKIEMKKTGSPSRKYFKDIIEYIKIKGKVIKYDGGIKDETTSKNFIKFA